MRLLPAAQQRGIAEKNGAATNPPPPLPLGVVPTPRVIKHARVLFLNRCLLFLLPPSLATPKRSTGYNLHDSITRPSSSQSQFVSPFTP